MIRTKIYLTLVATAILLAGCDSRFAIFEIPGLANDDKIFDNPVDPDGVAYQGFEVVTDATAVAPVNYDPTKGEKLFWSVVEDPMVTYRLTISPNPDLSAPVVDNLILYGPFYPLNARAFEPGNYYWRLEAIKAQAVQNSPVVRTFSLPVPTTAEASAPVALAGPTIQRAHGGITLSWPKESRRENYYAVEVSVDSQPGKVYIGNPYSTSITLSDLDWRKVHTAVIRTRSFSGQVSEASLPLTSDALPPDPVYFQDFYNGVEGWSSTRGWLGSNNAGDTFRITTQASQVIHEGQSAVFVDPGEETGSTEPEASIKTDFWGSPFAIQNFNGQLGGVDWSKNKILARIWVSEEYKSYPGSLGLTLDYPNKNVNLPLSALATGKWEVITLIPTAPSGGTPLRTGETMGNLFIESRKMGIATPYPKFYVDWICVSSSEPVGETWAEDFNDLSRGPDMSSWTRGPEEDPAATNNPWLGKVKITTVVFDSRSAVKVDFTGFTGHTPGFTYDGALIFGIPRDVKIKRQLKLTLFVEPHTGIGNTSLMVEYGIAKPNGSGGYNVFPTKDTRFNLPDLSPGNWHELVVDLEESNEYRDYVLNDSVPFILDEKTYPDLVQLRLRLDGINESSRPVIYLDKYEFGEFTPKPGTVTNLVYDYVTSLDSPFQVSYSSAHGSDGLTLNSNNPLSERIIRSNVTWEGRSALKVDLSAAGTDQGAEYYNMHFRIPFTRISGTSAKAKITLWPARNWQYQSKNFRFELNDSGNQTVNFQYADLTPETWNEIVLDIPGDFPGTTLTADQVSSIKIIMDGVSKDRLPLFYLDKFEIGDQVTGTPVPRTLFSENFGPEDDHNFIFSNSWINSGELGSNPMKGKTTLSLTEVSGRKALKVDMTAGASLPFGTISTEFRLYMPSWTKAGNVLRLGVYAPASFVATGREIHINLSDRSFDFQDVLISARNLVPDAWNDLYFQVPGDFKNVSINKDTVKNIRVVLHSYTPAELPVLYFGPVEFLDQAPAGYSQVSTLAGNTVSNPSVFSNEVTGLVQRADGSYYVADTFNHRIALVNASGSSVSNFVGTKGTWGYQDGSGTQVLFNRPRGLALDGTGNLYVADEHTQRIRKVSPLGVVSTFAGSGVIGGADGSGVLAEFSNPWGLCFDAQGNLLVSESGAGRIRKITPSGVVSTLAGDGIQGFADGTGSAARFSSPAGLAFDLGGNLLVADSGNNRIRKVTSAGVVTTIAGGNTFGMANGAPGNSLLHTPRNLLVTSGGDLYFTDFNNQRIRKISASGLVTTLAGNGFARTTDAPLASAELVNPMGIIRLSDGSLVFTEQGGRLRQIK